MGREQPPPLGYFAKQEEWSDLRKLESKSPFLAGDFLTERRRIVSQSKDRDTK